jgi:hypothetical protein
MNPIAKKAASMRRRLRTAVPALILFAAACASTPPIPDTSLKAAEQAIANAERVEAGAHAAVELGEARTKLASAQKAVNQEDMVLGAQLADEARASAELAAAKTAAIKASAVNDGIKRSTDTLKEEMQRKTGATQ